ncbi:MAG: SDR family NAD(P)-dependent oxidoreductase [Pseudomonadota bacterium]|uniref:SDR family NAD(P)-dependent oxidoreductase n=1 Tax=Phenylobacterium sp. TaxID=1871053 RepID=UPI0025FCAF0F|nr:SDR family NAD(P)-dependent oxidoreductase [Phenylobacterium sp.]MBT9470548.1 SDR family oxidoreductase [Phenylobacterium sp.]
MATLFDATERVLLLTGANGGIGRTIVEHHLEAGGSVAGLDFFATPPPPSRPDLEWIACDVTDESMIAQAVAATLARFGRIDAVVHAAGAVGQGPLVEVAKADWDRLIAVNLTSAFLIAKHVQPHLAATRGALVFLSSTNGRNGGSHLSGPAYAAAKAGVLNLNRYLAKEWAPLGVRVNAVAPGPVRTPMLDRLGDDGIAALARSMPTGALTEPEEIAAAVAFLLSPHARSMTGTVLNPSGGLVLD